MRKLISGGISGVVVAALTLGLLLVGLGQAQAVNCSSRTDSFGNTRGNCSDGTRWSERTDSFGYTRGRDNRGNRWTSRNDTFGHTNSRLDLGSRWP